MEDGSSEVVVSSRGDDPPVAAVGGGGSSSTVGFSSAKVMINGGMGVGGSDGGVGLGSNGIVKKKRDFKIAESRTFMSSFPSYSSCLTTSRREVVKESVGNNFRPYVEIVHTGEDVVGKILSFSQNGSAAICVLSATGIVSSVTINQPGSSSGSTLTYEGRFEILSLSGSYMFCETSISTHKMGMMSVSLAKSDGGVFGGAISGSLVAAGPVQLVVGCFNQNQKEGPGRAGRPSEMATAGGSWGGPPSCWGGGSGRIAGVDDFSDNCDVSSPELSEPENETEGITQPQRNNTFHSTRRASD